MKIDIGCGNKVLDGFERWDIKDGRKAYPIELPDNSVEEIHASHILEHFPHRSTLSVLKEWVRVLKPGGLIQIAVPDFNKIIEVYKTEQASKYPIEGYILGGQTDDNDFHYALFTIDKLKKLMELADLENIEEWASTKIDCAALPISLNLQGTKKIEEKKKEDVSHNVPEMRDSEKKVSEKIETANSDKKLTIDDNTKIIACWTTPRLGFLDTVDCMYNILPKFKIQAIRGTGVFWEMAMTRAFEEAIKKDAEWILTLDYDSIWEEKDLIDLVKIINKYPGEIDAICPHQWNRQIDKPLWYPILKEDGSLPEVMLEDLYTDRYPISSGHFGLTLIKVSAIKAMEQPWFLSSPNKDNKWEEGKVDADIYFWKKFIQNGNKLWLAPAVTLGHLELDLRWPGKGMKLLHQHMLDYRKEGKPKDIFDAKP